MGVDLKLYAIGATKMDRDKAELHIRKVLPPRQYEQLLYKDEPQFPGGTSPLYEGHFLTFASEENWSHEWEIDGLDLLEARTFLRWPMRGWWPDAHVLIRLLQEALPSTAKVYFAPDTHCLYDADPRWEATPERIERFWQLFLSDPDAYYAPYDL